MNTWIVGHTPAGHYTSPHRFLSSDPEKVEVQGEKTFFMRGRIMAGQADLTDNAFGLKDFRWLTRQEVQKTIHPKYFKMLGNMLGDR
jgi:large subunit ribosomal protein L46